MRSILLIAVLLAGCATKHEISYVSANAPQWTINPDKWNATTNQLVTAPTPGSPMVKR